MNPGGVIITRPNISLDFVSLFRKQFIFYWSQNFTKAIVCIITYLLKQVPKIIKCIPFLKIIDIQ